MLFELLYLVFLLTNLTFKKYLLEYIIGIFFVTTISGKRVVLNPESNPGKSYCVKVIQPIVSG